MKSCCIACSSTMYQVQLTEAACPDQGEAYISLLIRNPTCSSVYLTHHVKQWETKEVHAQISIQEVKMMEWIPWRFWRHQSLGVRKRVRGTLTKKGATDKTTHKIKSLGAIGYRTLVKVQILNPKLLLSPKHARQP